MPIQKYGQSEKAQVFRGEEAEIVNKHMSKVGKAVSDFDESQLDALNSELEVVRGSSDEQASVDNQEPQDAVNTEADASSTKRSSRKANN